MVRLYGDLQGAVEGHFVPGEIIYWPRQGATVYFASNGDSTASCETPMEAGTIARANTVLGASAGTFVGVGTGNVGTIALTAGQHLFEPNMDADDLADVAAGSIVRVRNTGTGEIRGNNNIDFECDDLAGTLIIPAGTGSNRTRIKIRRITSTGELRLLATGSVYLDVMRNEGTFTNTGNMRVIGPGIASNDAAPESLTKSVGSNYDTVQDFGGVDGPHSISAAADIVLIDTTERDPIGNLPSALNGDRKLIIDSGNSASVDNLVINAAGGNTIGGAASQSITTDGGQMEIVAVGTDWRVL